MATIVTRMTRWAVLCTGIALAGTANAQEGTIKLVLGVPAGASSDILTRVIADHMRQSLGQAVIVENKAGAGGRVALEDVKAAAPDGNTLAMSAVAGISIFPHSFGNLRYDPFRDFAPVAHLWDFQLALGTSTMVPAKTLAEYVALVKKDPKLAFYASSAPGSIPHFLGVMFARVAGIELEHVPYKGPAPMLQALAAGEIAAGSAMAADIGSLAKSGKARMLAVSGEQRAKAYPDVPTFKEQGFDMAASAWYALFAPAKTPQAVVDRLSKAAIMATKDAAVNGRMLQMGVEPTGYGPEALARIMRADYDKWGPVIRASGFKPAP